MIELTQLETCRTPKEKSAVLVAAHKLVVGAFTAFFSLPLGRCSTPLRQMNCQNSRLSSLYPTTINHLHRYHHRRTAAS